MSAPRRPKLLPKTTHTSTRYEVDILDKPTGQWYLAHQRATLEGAKKAKQQLAARGWFARLVAVSEERRLISDVPTNSNPLNRSARHLEIHGDDDETNDHCRTDNCDGDPDDGDGWDGFCGNCADRQEIAREADEATDSPWSDPES
jgi:hypothetical protein